MVVGFCFVLMFLFVPETFWDRTPRPHKSRKTTFAALSAIFHHPHERKSATEFGTDGASDVRRLAIGNAANNAAYGSATIAERRRNKQSQHHVGFANQDDLRDTSAVDKDDHPPTEGAHTSEDSEKGPEESTPRPSSLAIRELPTPASHTDADKVVPCGEGPKTPGLRNFNSPYYSTHEKQDTDYVENEHEDSTPAASTPHSTHSYFPDSGHGEASPASSIHTGRQRYTTFLRTQPPKTYRQTLKPWNGRLRHEKWYLVALRPFILFAYPSILWSTLVYSLSIGWLIVLSESVSEIYKSKDTYNFTSLQAGLVYISPFVGGVIGTAVAGKVSDVIVRFMSRRNGGVYEPEFRLVMAIPVAISTCIGLMGFGWSAEEKDNWIVPTVFFGIISFGCSLGSTTSITFAVDSYRQYAGEALVTLNFSKSKLIY